MFGSVGFVLVVIGCFCQTSPATAIPNSCALYRTREGVIRAGNARSTNKLTCFSGYTLASATDTHKTCDPSSGSPAGWVGKAECVYKQNWCPETRIAGGFITGGIRDASANVTCHKDFSRINGTQYTCNLDPTRTIWSRGYWTGGNQQCIHDSHICEASDSSVTNGRLPRMISGQSAVVQCDLGYTPFSPSNGNRFTCNQTNGQASWVGDTTCNAIPNYCAKVNTREGVISAGNVGSSNKLTCHPGWILANATDTHKTCRPSSANPARGTWAGTAECVYEQNWCPVIPIAGGFIAGGIRHASVDVTCHKEFRRISGPQYTCNFNRTISESRGYWTGGNQQCIHITDYCASLLTDRFYLSAGNVRSSTRLICRWGWALANAADTHRTCKPSPGNPARFTWEGTAKCVLIPNYCRGMAIQNGFVRAASVKGNGNVICNSGYQGSGIFNKYICRGSSPLIGRWDGNSPCIPAPNTFACPVPSRYELFRPSQGFAVNFQQAQQRCLEEKAILPPFSLRTCVAAAARTAFFEHEGSWLDQLYTDDKTAFAMTKSAQGNSVLLTYNVNQAFPVVCARELPDCGPLGGFQYNSVLGRCLKHPQKLATISDMVANCDKHNAALLVPLTYEQDLELRRLVPQDQLLLGIVQLVGEKTFRNFYTREEVNYFNLRPRSPYHNNTVAEDSDVWVQRYQVPGKYQWNGGGGNYMKYVCEKRLTEVKCPKRDYMMVAVAFRAANVTNYRLRKRLCLSAGADLPFEKHSKSCVQSMKSRMDPFTTTYQDTRAIYNSTYHYRFLLCEKPSDTRAINGDYDVSGKQYICPSNIHKFMKAPSNMAYEQARDYCKDLGGDLPGAGTRTCLADALTEFWMITSLSSVTDGSHGNVQQWTHQRNIHWIRRNRVQPFLCQLAVSRIDQEFHVKTVIQDCSGFELYLPFPATGNPTSLCKRSGGVLYMNMPSCAAANNHPKKSQLCARQKLYVRKICPDQQRELVVIANVLPAFQQVNKRSILCDRLADGTADDVSSACRANTPTAGIHCSRAVTNLDLFLSGQDYRMDVINNKPVQLYKPVPGRTCETSGGTVHEDRCKRDDKNCDTTRDGYCYKFFLTSHSWQYARKTCQKWSGELATIDSQALYSKTLIAASGRNVHKFWIGLNRLPQPHNKWAWTTNVTHLPNFRTKQRPITPVSSTTYTPWGTNQPNVVSWGEYCVVSISSPTVVQSTWHDYPCSVHFHFLCQRDRFL